MQKNTLRAILNNAEYLSNLTIAIWLIVDNTAYLLQPLWWKLGDNAYLIYLESISPAFFFLAVILFIIGIAKRTKKHNFDQRFIISILLILGIALVFIHIES